MLFQTVVLFATLVIGWRWNKLLANPERSIFTKVAYYFGLVLGYMVLVFIFVIVFMPTY
jgi:hypothetical protein